MPLKPLTINPPLLNSSSPWATTPEDLLALYNCPSTGAVTIRTSLLNGFKQHPDTHQYTFFDPDVGISMTTIKPSVTGEGRGDVSTEHARTETSSLNTLGYSPKPLQTYLDTLVEFATSGKLTRRPAKPFIVSVSGSAQDVAECLNKTIETAIKVQNMAALASKESSLQLMMEINLSCPNIENKSPPAYSGPALIEYLQALVDARITAAKIHDNTAYTESWDIHIGIKIPPYTYAEQFTTLITALESVDPCPISFITATNTLGNSLVLKSSLTPALGSVTGAGIGGMAGASLHPLSVGNVSTLRKLLDASKLQSVRNIQVIGIGGVSDGDGWRRMRSVGASAVGVGTAFGRRGLEVFGEIERDVKKVEREEGFLWKKFGPRHC